MHHGEMVGREFKGERWTTVPENDPGDHAKAAERFGLSVVYGDSSPGLASGGRITYGGNSGHQAVHLAYNFGAARILLLGYDFEGNGNHWFGHHPQPLHSGHDLALWLRNIIVLGAALAAKGVEVINCSRSTAITCFPRMSIDDVESDSDRAERRAGHAAGGKGTPHR